MFKMMNVCLKQCMCKTKFQTEIELPCFHARPLTFQIEMYTNDIINAEEKEKLNMFVCHFQKHDIT
jgi:hypothetical protein